MLVELKNGETLNGHLVTCDTWMNLTLKEVVQTSPVSMRQHRKRVVWGRKRPADGGLGTGSWEKAPMVVERGEGARGEGYICIYGAQWKRKAKKTS
jgi:small nuclear ribonucleoprotein (snRNP)-like protein